MSSMLYTIGMALDRAADNGFSVSLLVEGHWVEGRVGANDGTGVVLQSADGHHCVVRTERISVVRIHADSPYEASPTRGQGAGSWSVETATELPATARGEAAA
jgi:hypothetical protein